MPVYEYECQSCHKVQEALQKFSDAPLTQCECGGGLKRLVSRTSFQLKGGGWYATDYKKPAAKSPEESAKSSNASTKSDKPSTSKGNSGDGE